MQVKSVQLNSCLDRSHRDHRWIPTVDFFLFTSFIYHIIYIISGVPVKRNQPWASKDALRYIVFTMLSDEVTFLHDHDFDSSFKYNIYVIEIQNFNCIYLNLKRKYLFKLH